MQPRISEFSFGFALTHELVGWSALNAAPYFPTQYAEGRAGGGFDVMLDRPTVPLYLQFKRAEFLERRSGKEYKACRDLRHPNRLDVPYHRFSIMDSDHSDQHSLLVALQGAQPGALVAYAAPRFHEVRHLNRAWDNREVTSRSVFVRPIDIGILSPGKHTFAYDAVSLHGGWVCSDPSFVSIFSFEQLSEKLFGLLKSQEEQPAQERLAQWRDDFGAARIRAIQMAHSQATRLDRYERRILHSRQTWSDRNFNEFEATSIDFRPATLEPDRAALRQIAEEALKNFGVEMILVQERAD